MELTAKDFKIIIMTNLIGLFNKMVFQISIMFKLQVKIHLKTKKNYKVNNLKIDTLKKCWCLMDLKMKKKTPKFDFL